MIKLTHIINPVNVSEASDLYLAQPVTFDTMLKAKQFAGNEIEINLTTTQYPEDLSIVPKFFTKTKDLERSILDFGTFDSSKRLPLLVDIFDRTIKENIESDYIIYSNVDIALYPNFYVSITEYIKSGYDAICINRNTIKPKNDDYNLSSLYGIKGTNHEGIDCFVIKKTLIPALQLHNAVIGTGPLGLILICNLIHFAKKSIWLQNSNLTFHIGDDKNWLNEKVSEKSMLFYNYNQLRIVLEELISKEVDYVKMDVLISVLDHTKYFLKNLKFLEKPVHREKLRLYSDRQFDELLELDHQKLKSATNDNKKSRNNLNFNFNKKSPHIFLHIHKSGGTSLMNSIDANYAKEKIYVIDGTDYRNSYDYFKKQPLSYRKKIDLLRGHHFFGSHQFLRKNAVYFTMVREPLARLCSLYNYLREIDLYSTINKQDMGLKQFLDSGLAMAADNGITRLLTNNDFDKVPNGMIKESHALEAIQNLKQHFAVIGITERFEDSISLFKYILGWKVLPQVKADNKTSVKLIEVKQVQSFFKNNDDYCKYIHADVMVYRYVYKQFQKAIKSLNT